MLLGGKLLQDFEYVVPKTLKEAVSLMTEGGPGCRAFAGGTDILVQLRGGRFAVDRLVDVKHVPEMNEISYSPQQGLVLGASVPCFRVYEDTVIQNMYPGLVDAAFIIGGIQIQGRASIGGNLCNASPSGDTIPALIVLGASCIIEGPQGSRRILVEDFCVSPGKNALTDGELLVALEFPPPKQHSGAHYLRFIPRNEMDIAVAGVGASVVLGQDKRIIESARVALSAVGPTPIFVRAAGELIAGKEAGEESYEIAAEAARAAASPIDDMRGTIRQRIHLAGVLTKRALREAVARAKEG